MFLVTVSLMQDQLARLPLGLRGEALFSGQRAMETQVVVNVSTPSPCACTALTRCRVCGTRVLRMGQSVSYLYLPSASSVVVSSACCEPACSHQFHWCVVWFGWTRFDACGEVVVPVPAPLAMQYATSHRRRSACLPSGVY